MMQLIFRFLAAAAGIYSLLIFIRIIISWFAGNISGRPVDLLLRVTDPYLDWWRRALNLRIGFIDLSPLAAVAFLSVVQSIFNALSRFDRVGVGTILSIVLLSAWSVVSFVLLFCIVVIILRLIGYIANRDIYSPFWRVIDTISQPLLYRINRIFFGRGIPNYLKGIIVSIIALAALWIGGRFLVTLLVKLFSGMPF